MRPPHFVSLWLLCAVAVLGAEGCGMVTHNLIAQTARAFYKDAHGIGGEALITKHLDALQVGRDEGRRRRWREKGRKRGREAGKEEESVRSLRRSPHR